MNFYQLNYFIILAHLQHYTKAAEQLHITQPNLSHAMHALEQELGVPLFERQGRNVVLTKYGELFLQDAEKIVKTAECSVKKMRQIHNGEECLKIGFLRVLGTRYIPKCLAEFRRTEEGRHITFQFYENISKNLIVSLKNRECDVVFCSKTGEDPDIIYVPVQRHNFYVITPLDHPLAEKEEITLEETLPYPQIYFSPQSAIRNVVDEMFASIGARPEIVMELMEDQVIAGFVAENFGIALIEDIMVLSQLPVKKIKLRSEQHEHIFYMAYRRTNVRSYALQCFINYIREYSDL